ncbi:hypothetical protein ACJ2A9_16205 [Anaerobacillus sp. MEB173]|uniref:hypothetical protein n=1 Tax=Anaerobacillus sp. MEB173 TaxID=3383345 RepID=UPI003F8F63A1
MCFYIVVKKAFEHKVDCFHSGQQYRDVFRFNRGDVIEITQERKYIAELGWYFRVNINNIVSYFMSISAIENYYRENKVCSLLDLELEVNYWDFQVDTALEKREENLFQTGAKQLKKVKELYQDVYTKVY